MGIAVRNAAYSPNIKERLDHSCALFDRCGRLIAQAEHIPVHLGSLPWGLRRMLARTSRSAATDAPGRACGSSTIRTSPERTSTTSRSIRPIFHRRVTGRLRGEQGPPCRRRRRRARFDAADARDLFAEGLRRAADAPGRDDASFPRWSSSFRANSRTPEARSGDLRAQIAGNVTGERRVLELLRTLRRRRLRCGDRTSARRERDAACAPRCARLATASSSSRTCSKTADGGASIVLAAAVRDRATARSRGLCRHRAASRRIRSTPSSA